jgi:hypothetical protein
VSNEAGRQWRHDFGEYGVTLAGEVSRSVASARFRRSGAGKKERMRAGKQESARGRERERKRECGRRGEHVGKRRARAQPTLLSRTPPLLSHSPSVLCSCAAAAPARQREKEDAGPPLLASRLCSLPGRGCRPCSFLCVWLLLATPGPCPSLYAPLPLLVLFSNTVN